MQQQETETLAQASIHPGLRLGVWMRPLVVGMAAAVSLLVHAGIVLAALDWARRIDPGAISEPSDAVSVELAATDTIDAMRPERTSEPAPSPEAPAPVAGSSAPTQPAEPVEPPEKHEPVEKPQTAAVPDADDPETRAPDRGEPVDVPAAQVANSPAETVSEAAKANVQGEETQSKRKETKHVEKKAARPKGGIVSKAKAGKGTGGGQISASTGSMLAYRNLVRACVAPNRSSQTGAVGTAVVEFRLTSTGALAYARIVRSSGNATNDATALAVVRDAAPCPPPPAGATPAQLQFTVPYDFR